jgi:hypothetical protein
LKNEKQKHDLNSSADPTNLPWIDENIGKDDLRDACKECLLEGNSQVLDEYIDVQSSKGRAEVIQAIMSEVLDHRDPVLQLRVMAKVVGATDMTHRQIANIHHVTHAAVVERCSSLRERLGGMRAPNSHRAKGRRIKEQSSRSMTIAFRLSAKRLSHRCDECKGVEREQIIDAMKEVIGELWLICGRE